MPLPVLISFASIGAFAGSVVGQLLIGTALSALSTALQRQNQPDSPGIRTEVTTEGSVTPQTFILGRYATAGNLVSPPYATGTPRGIPNGYRVSVVDVSDVPITAWRALWVDGDKYDVADLVQDAHSDGITYLRPAAGDFADALRIVFYDGSQSAADPYMLREFASHAERPWQSDMIGRGVAYAVLNFRYDPELYQGEPSLLFEVEGAALYDPRKDSTAGGSGSHRWGNQSTWEWTENPAVMVYNLLRGITLPDGGVYGLGVAADDLPAAWWHAAMDHCEETVGSVPRYRAGYEVKMATAEDGGDAPLDVIDELLKAMDAELCDLGGTWIIRAGAPLAAAATITDEDILRSSPQDLDPFKGLAETYNAVRASHPLPSSMWQATEAPPRYDEEAEAEDGQRLVADIDLPAVPYPGQVQRLMRAWLKDARRMRRHTIVLPPQYSDLTPLDTIEWSSDRNGYASKLFEIGDVEIDALSLSVRVTMRERNPADYDWQPTYELPSEAPSQLIVPITRVPLPGFDAQPVTIKDAGGRSRRAAIEMTWPGDLSSDMRTIAWQIRIAATGEVVNVGSMSDVAEGRTVVSEGILSDTLYEVRGRGLRQRTEWSDWIAARTDAVALLPDEFGPSVWDEVETRADQIVADFEANIIQPQFDGIEGRFGSIEVDLDLRRSGQVDLADYADTIFERIAWLQTKLDETQGRMSDAGIFVDPESGTVKIAAIDRSETRIGEAEIRLNAADAEISLRATYAEMNQAISEALLDPTQIPVVDDLQLRITNVETDLDAVSGTITSKADSTAVDGLDVRLTSAEQEIDGLEATITQKVDTAAFTPLETRVTTAEQELAALDGASIRQSVVDTRSLADADALAEVQTLQDVINAYKDREAIRVDLAYAQQEITAKVEANRVAEAAARSQLGVAIDSNKALIETEQKVRASETLSLAQDLTQLEADLTSAGNGVAANANAISGLVTRVTDAEGDIVAVSQELTQLQADLTAAENDISANATATTNLAARVTSAEGKVTSQGQSITRLQSDLDAAESNISGNASAVSGLTTRVTSAEGKITSQASDITTLKSRVGSAEAEIQAVASTTDGISAQYSVTINNNGHVSGFGLVSDILDGKATSQFAVSAAAFHIASPDGSLEQSPFYAVTQTTNIGGVQVPPGVYMGKAVIREAFIDTLEIAGEAATVPVRSFTAGDVLVDSFANWVTIAELSINRRGISTDLSVSFSLDGEGGNGVCELGLFRGNSADHFRYAENATGPGGHQVQVAFNAVDFDSGTGPTTYRIKARRMNRSGGFDSRFWIRRRYFSATQFRR